MVRVAAAPRRFVWPVVLTLTIACSGPPPGVTELDVILFGSDVYDAASAVVADAGGWLVGGASTGTIAGEQALGIAGFVAAFDARGAERWSAVVAKTGSDTGDADAVVVALAASGGQRWAWQGGGPGYDGAVGLAVDGEGRVAVVGCVEDGLGSVPSLGGVEPYDAFLVVLRPPAY